MSPVLIVEIISALVAAACVIIMLARYLSSRFNRKQPGNACQTKQSMHIVLGIALLASCLVHGISATMYASGAPVLAYVFGWAALVCFVASAWSMLWQASLRLDNPYRLHIILFFAGLVFVVVHAIIGRL